MRWLVLAAAALGCSGKGAAGQDSGDTAGDLLYEHPGTKETHGTLGFTSSGPEVVLGPLTITGAEVACDGDVEVRYYAAANGWTTGMLVDSMETGNVSPWNDYHHMRTLEYAEDGSWETLLLRLQTDVSLERWEPERSTLFDCQTHFEQDVMTYIFRVYDTTGAPADCVYLGDDGPGVIEGDYPFINPPLDPDEWEGCTRL